MQLYFFVTKDLENLKGHNVHASKQGKIGAVVSFPLP